ncbi:MAG TPA: response regulator [Steroidobacter sp.]|jgi:DNA-binding response OmpR family regulator|nr:response regulator [Steroidobacter sp.]
MHTVRSPDAARILVVEDELLVRMFAVDSLEDEGFTVTQASDAAQALQEIAAGGANAFTAVVIDLGLPDRSGDQLAAEIRATDAEVPIVIASGRSERELKERFAGDDAIALLVKPYTAMLLLDALESLGVRTPAAR